MKQANEAAVMTAIREIKLESIPMPQVGADEVIIKMEYVGICGSDIHFFGSGIRKGVYFGLPLILGHECSGTVVSTGKDAFRFSPGDKVTLEPQITCGKCSYCKSGRYNLCPEVHFPSVPPHDGMLCRYAAIPAHLAYKLPDSLDTLYGSLVEPMAVGLSAAERGGVSLGKTVVILGAGCIGLTITLACKAMGAQRIIVSDLQEKRGAKALEIGASHFINASNMDIVSQVMDLTDGAGADIVFEAAGSSVAAAVTPAILRRGGIIVMVGNINGETSFPFMDLMYKEGDIRTVYRYKNNFPAAIQMVASNKSKIEKIISHVYPFEKTQEAFEYVLNRQHDIIKAIIRFD